MANKILCGGTGLYLDAVLKRYKLINVPVNEDLRKDLADKSIFELTSILSSFKNLHNTTDTINKKRLLRAIEIETYLRDNPKINSSFPDFRTTVFGIKYNRDERRKKSQKDLKKDYNREW